MNPGLSMTALSGPHAELPARHPSLASLMAGLCLVLLGACGSDMNGDGIQVTTPDRFAQFYPSKGILPYPNNLLFQGSDDGTLNAPYDPESAVADMVGPLNTLDGFSTIAPINASFNVEPDAASIVAGDTVRVFEVTLAGTGGAVTSILRELDTSEYSVGLDLATPRGIAILPVRALPPRTSYLIMMSAAINDVDGRSIAASSVYALCKSRRALIDSQGKSQVQRVTDAEAAELEPVRQLTVAAEDALIGFDNSIKRSDIILSWSFTTQSIDDALLAVRAAINSSAPPPSTLSDYGRDTPGKQARVYTGTITLPYYLAVPTAEDPEAPLTGFWRAAGGQYITHERPMPEATVVKPIPLLVTIPLGSKPAGGWPVVIFQHGNTSNRTALVALADKLAQQGLAAVAIDLPMHGVTGDEVDDSRLLYQAGLERTFDLDLINNTTSVPGADGLKDTSGSYFIKLNQVLTTRDNIRQGAADLMGLRRALAIMDYDGGGPDFDTRQVRFVGHSAGATVGAVYLGVEDGNDVGASTLGMPGGAIAKQLDGSPTSGPSIALGMSENGLFKGTQDYERFLAAVQMVLDSADPLNYAKGAVRNRPLHLIEVVGGSLLAGGGLSLPDQIVPNHVLDAPDTVASPTGGTDPLWQSMGLSIASGTSAADRLQLVVRFNAGHHSSLISTFDADGNMDELSSRVQGEMQTQIASFAASNGTSLTIADPTLVNAD